MRDTKNGSNPQNHLDYFHFFMSYQLISMRELPASVTIQTTADFFHSWHGQISWHHRGIKQTFQAFFAEKIFQSLNDRWERTLSIRKVFQSVAKDMAQGVSLFHVSQLLHVTQIHSLTVQGEGIPGQNFQLHAVLVSASLARTGGRG